MIKVPDQYPTRSTSLIPGRDTVLHGFGVPKHRFTDCTAFFLEVEQTLEVRNNVKQHTARFGNRHDSEFLCNIYHFGVVFHELSSV